MIMSNMVSRDSLSSPSDLKKQTYDAISRSGFTQHIPKFYETTCYSGNYFQIPI